MDDHHFLAPLKNTLNYFFGECFFFGKNICYLVTKKKKMNKLEIFGGKFEFNKRCEKME
jgi:hypothetical protein